MAFYRQKEKYILEAFPHTLQSPRAKNPSASQGSHLGEKGSSRTILCGPHAPKENPQSLDIHISAIIRMVCHPRHSLHVCSRHVQVTVSRARGIHLLLRGASGSNNSAALRSRLRRDREVLARPRGVRIVMTSAMGSTPTYPADPAPRHSR